MGPLRLVCCVVLVAGTAAVTTGCDDLSSGHVGDPSGPVRLIKVLVQDSNYVGGPPSQRAGIVDLLDKAPPPTCSDINPCVNQFLVAQTTPPLECSDPQGGVCVDPLAIPQAGVPLNAGATNIRLVFNKLLDNSIEQVTVDPNGAPTGSAPYKLVAGIVELIGPTGQPVAGTTAYWDASGSPDFTSDVILIPFGPAIVITPGSLDPSTKYTIRIHPPMIKDRKGNPAATVDGAALADPTDFVFTTEPITPNADLSFPDFTKSPTTIAPDEVLQFAFWETLDEKTVTVTATGPAGFVPAQVEVFADRGGDPKACAAGENDALLDFVYTTGAAAARMPADWPAGDYTLSFTVKDTGGAATYTSPTLHFTVAGNAGGAGDANSFANHVTPEQCQ
jgi:hypothetical protein